MAERVKLMKEMLEIGQSFGFKGTELQQYVEKQVTVAENQARDERAARRAQEKEDEKEAERVRLEIEKQHLQLQINAEETKAGRIADIERESAVRKAALERDAQIS